MVDTGSTDSKCLWLMGECTAPCSVWHSQQNVCLLPAPDLPRPLGRIEKKRTVVPTLAEAIQDGREVNWEYFYSLLFTAENLKLVHIACHKKTTHRLQCDRSRIYQPQTGSRRKQPARKRRTQKHQ